MSHLENRYKGNRYFKAFTYFLGKTKCRKKCRLITFRFFVLYQGRPFWDG